MIMCKVVENKSHSVVVPTTWQYKREQFSVNNKIIRNNLVSNSSLKCSFIMTRERSQLQTCLHVLQGNTEHAAEQLAFALSTIHTIHTLTFHFSPTILSSQIVVYKLLTTDKNLSKTTVSVSSF